MNWQGKRVVLTGAAGGIGSLLARMILSGGARAALIDANADALRAQFDGIDGATAVPGDLSSSPGCIAVVETAMEALGGIDVLVNLAGLMSFSTYEDEDADRISTLMHVNLIAPMLLSRAVLPAMLDQGSGRIINVGSMFGSIGFAYFTAYSASKFGLRGFSQALRRELADHAIDVVYISPRAIRTPINTGPIMAMGAATKMNMDGPDAGAARIFAAMTAGRKEAYLGFPESLFARINAVWPGIIDRATRTQNRTARSFAQPAGRDTDRG